MYGMSELMMALVSLKIFESIESIDYNSISKDHIGEVRVIFQGETIQEFVYTFDDEFSLSKRIIEKSSLK
jgi:hypothetical protein